MRMTKVGIRFALGTLAFPSADPVELVLQQGLDWQMQKPGTVQGDPLHAYIQCPHTPGLGLKPQLRWQ